MSSRNCARSGEDCIGLTKEDTPDKQTPRKRRKGAILLEETIKNESVIVADDCLRNGQTKSRGRPRQHKRSLNDSSPSGCDDSVNEEGGRINPERGKQAKRDTSDAETTDGEIKLKSPLGSDKGSVRKRERPSSNLSKEAPNFTTKDVKTDDDVENDVLPKNVNENEQQDSFDEPVAENCGESGIHTPKRGRPKGSRRSKARGRGDISMSDKSPIPTESCDINSGDIVSGNEDNEEVSDIQDKPLNKSSSKRGRPRGSIQGRGRGRGILKDFSDTEENVNEDGKMISDDVNSNACNGEKHDEMDSKTGDLGGHELEDVHDLLTSTPVQGTLRGAKRGRGRPRKSPIVNISKNNDDNSDKDLMDMSADNSQELLSNVCDQGNLSLECSTDLSTSGTTRKRGRPRGSGRGRGRGRGNIPDVSFDASCENLTERSARKRQRPSYLSSDDECIDETKVTPKRGRGRGRPPKSNRRGRGRGALSDGQDDGDVLFNTICLRCDVDQETKVKLKHHLMSEHSALWTEWCHEGDRSHSSLATIISRIGRIHCEKCDKELRSMQYHSFHKKWCGREEETEVCPVCSRMQKTMYLAMHVAAHKRQHLAPVETPTAEDILSPRRASAMLAHSNMKKFSSVLLSDDDDDDDEDDYDPARDAKAAVDEDESDGSEGPCREAPVRKEAPAVRARHSNAIRRPGKYFVTTDILTPDYFDDVMMILRQRNKEPLFTNLLPQPDMYALITDERLKIKYLPQVDCSPYFTINYNRKTGELEQLKRFESKIHSESASLFVGGPVWAMAWCPRLDDLRSDQVMAVVCYDQMDRTCKLNDTLVCPGLIQLWNCGKLVGTKSIDTTPFMMLGLAHDYGIIRGMAWCPNTSYLSQTQIEALADKEDKVAPRLGLLAAACSDGTVRIFSIPEFECMTNQNAMTDDRLYQAKPSITLDMIRKSPESCSCMCVAWQACGEYRYIAAGYGKGVVRIWDLKTESSLLRSESFSGMSLYPIRSFMAHCGAVKFCAWSKQSPDHFCTGGKARLSKIWNMWDISFPKTSSSSANYATSGVWPLLWCGFIDTHDNCYEIGNHSNVFTDSGYYGSKYQKRHFISSTATQWDLTFSDFLNTMAVCDSAGTVSAYKCIPLNVDTGTKCRDGRKLRIFTTHLKRRTDTGDGSNQDDSDKEPKDASDGSTKDATSKEPMYPSDGCTQDATNKEPVNPSDGSTQDATNKEPRNPGDGSTQDATNKEPENPSDGSTQDESDKGPMDASNADKEILTTEDKCYSSYNAIAKEMYISYTDENLVNVVCDDRNKRLPVQPEDPMNQYPLAAIYTIEVNPNPQSCSWMITGGQAGIVRLHNIRGLLTNINKSSISNMVDS